MVRPTDQEMPATENITCYHSSQEGGARHLSQSHTGSPRRSEEAEGARGDVGESLVSGFHGKERVRQGQQAKQVRTGSFE